MSSRLQNLIVFLGLIIIAALGYYLYSNNRDSVLSLNSDTVNTQVAIESAEFAERLEELKSITLDDSLFTDPRFQSFINYRPPVIEEEVGRANPFLEVEDEDS